jgi:hypothetical protein
MIVCLKEGDDIEMDQRPTKIDLAAASMTLLWTALSPKPSACTRTSGLLLHKLIAWLLPGLVSASSESSGGALERPDDRYFS